MDYDTLVENCEKDTSSGFSGFVDTLVQVIEATMGVAGFVLEPSYSGAAFAYGFLLEGIATIKQVGTSALGFSQSFSQPDVLWNPNIQLPPLPSLNADGAFENQTYADASYDWYLEAQTKTSNSLVNMSSAYWDSIYLANEKQITPSEFEPCCEESVLY